MSKKTCPSCNAVHGPRKKVCECGHNFGVKSTSSLYPEPGDWVNDMPKGMEPIEVKGCPIDADMMTTEDIRREVEYEGLGFCIYEYLPPNKIEDRVLRALWKRAKEAMRDVRVWIEENS